ncbi:MAG: hypothetical protein LBR07_05685 [Puniceicoccales bacterium]|jgi:uncharacterized repeat protein (TIGR04138 family)|nr:hypothetical protein [Puniceicoccales bacterium]
MDEEQAFREAVCKIVAKDDRYPPQAYCFVRDVIAATVRKLREDAAKRRPPVKRFPPGNIATGEFLDGFREHALEEYGPLAATLLERWSVTTGADLAAIVANLIEHGVIGRGNDDNREALAKFDFDAQLNAPFRPKKETVESIARALQRANSPAQVVPDEPEKTKKKAAAKTPPAAKATKATKAAKAPPAAKAKSASKSGKVAKVVRPRKGKGGRAGKSGFADDKG